MQPSMCRRAHSVFATELTAEIEDRGKPGLLRDEADRLIPVHELLGGSLKTDQAMSALRRDAELQLEEMREPALRESGSLREFGDARWRDQLFLHGAQSSTDPRIDVRHRERIAHRKEEDLAEANEREFGLDLPLFRSALHTAANRREESSCLGCL